MLDGHNMTGIIGAAVLDEAQNAACEACLSFPDARAFSYTVTTRS